MRNCDPRLPRWPGETALDYVHRLAVFLGFMADDAGVATARRPMDPEADDDEAGFAAAFASLDARGSGDSRRDQPPGGGIGAEWAGEGDGDGGW